MGPSPWQQTVISSLKFTDHYCPAHLSVECTTLYAVPHSQEFSTCTILSLECWLSPCITSFPAVYHLLPNPPNTKVRRSLTLVSMHSTPSPSTHPQNITIPTPIHHHHHHNHTHTPTHLHTITTIPTHPHTITTHKPTHHHHPHTYTPSPPTHLHIITTLPTHHHPQAHTPTHHHLQARTPSLLCAFSSHIQSHASEDFKLAGN